MKRNIRVNYYVIKDLRYINRSCMQCKENIKTIKR